MLERWPRPLPVGKDSEEQLLQPAVPANQSGTDQQAVRAALEDYVVGWREGDVEKLADVFALYGVITWLSGAGPNAVLNRLTREQVLARGYRPQVEYGREWRIELLDVVDGRAAVARLYVSRVGGHYIEYLTLHWLDDRWRIVCKTSIAR